MSDPDGQRQSGKAAMVTALNVPRNAKVGFAGALVVTAAIFALFVLPGTQRPAYLYLALGFVLAASLGGLLTVLLTVVSAVRLARADAP
ncbi:DUF7536 family protein [Halomicroarcula sp. GCM10025743]|uniref:DUF7536 family protein n=1 Tax=Haloarcula TaxID=2237 RepID=UPI00361CB130